MRGDFRISKSFPEIVLNNTNISDGHFFNAFYSDAGIVNIQNRKDNSSYTSLYINKETVDLYKMVRVEVCTNGSKTAYNIFGEHNKPSGSYTGNGSSTTRTINIGGVGNILYISSPYGFGFVTADGGFFVQASYDTTAYVVSYSSSYIKFVDGVLTIESSSSYINSSSYTYTYRVL